MDELKGLRRYHPVPQTNDKKQYQAATLAVCHEYCEE